MKACTRCGETKPLDKFHHRRDARRPHLGERPVGRCKDCERGRNRATLRRLRRSASSTYEADMVRLGRLEAERRAIRRRHRPGRLRFAAHLRRVEAALRTTELGPLKERTCARCTSLFAPVCHHQRYCSDECNWREQRSRRRARVREAYVEHVDLADIYARDGGLCQLCFGRVDRRCRYPHPRTPVLDHIVPLARGGRHERRNVQLAHHGCNNAKNVRAAGSQLRLVG